MATRFLRRCSEGVEQHADRVWEIGKRSITEDIHSRIHALNPTSCFSRVIGGPAAGDVIPLIFSKLKKFY